MIPYALRTPNTGENAIERVKEKEKNTIQVKKYETCTKRS